MKKTLTAGLLAITAAIFVILTLNASDWLRVEGPAPAALVGLGGPGGSLADLVEVPDPVRAGALMVDSPVAEAVANTEDESSDSGVPRSVSCRVRFVTQAGDPVLGVKVRIRWDGPFSYSDSSGVVVLCEPLKAGRDSTGVSAGYYHEDFLDGSLGSKLEFGIELDLGDIVLKRIGALEVRVVDSGGAPLEDAWVTWSEIGVHSQDPDILKHEQYWASAMVMSGRSPRIPGQGSMSMTDVSGTAHLPQIPLGKIRVWAVGKEHLANWTEPLEISRGGAAETVTVVLDLLDNSDFIRVRVEEFRDSYGDTIIDCAYETPEGPVKQVWRLSTPVLVLPYFPRIPRDFQASSDRMFLGRVDTSLHRGAVGGDEVLLRVPNSVFMALEVTSDIVRVQELHYAQASGQNVRRGVLESWGQAGKTPVAFKVPIGPGEFTLTLSAEGCVDVELGPFQEIDPSHVYKVHMPGLPVVSGRVLAQGKPIANAQVGLYELTDKKILLNHFPSRVGASQRWWAKTNQDGVFASSPRESGRFYLRAVAEGYAPTEMGPMTIDAAQGLSDLVVNLTAGGAIEGRIQGPGDVANQVVVFSRGDSCVQETRTGEDGTYRVDHLMPGSWWVSVAPAELNRSGRHVRETDEPFRESDIKTNCVVLEGQTTQHLLTLPAQMNHVVEGRLLLDGKPATEWTASLGVAGDWLGRRRGGSKCPIAEDGSFRFNVPWKGRYLLSLTRGLPEGDWLIFDPLMALTIEVDVGAESNVYHLDYPTGSVRLHGIKSRIISHHFMEISSFEQVPLVRGVGGGATMTLLPSLWAVGTSLIEGVPAMPAQITKLDLQSIEKWSDPLKLGVGLSEFVIQAGQTVDVAMPK